MVKGGFHDKKGPIPITLFFLIEKKIDFFYEVVLYQNYMVSQILFYSKK